MIACLSINFISLCNYILCCFIPFWHILFKIFLTVDFLMATGHLPKYDGNEALLAFLW